jgi:hypothetical protein
MKTIFETSLAQVLVYYLFVAFLLAYSLYKFRKDSLFVLIVFLFYIGLFVYLGKSTQNFFRIITLLYALYLTQKRVKLRTISAEPFIVICFILFTITFLVSSSLNEDSFTLMLSQYSRYLLIILFYFNLQQRISSPDFRQELNRLVYHLILVQVILAFIKVVVIGPMESIVGSLSYNGGAIAGVLPILGFAFLWMYRQGNFSKYDWIYIFGLIFIGFVNYKRAVWFVFPVFILIFMFYVQRRRIKRYLLVLALLVPGIIYLGIRINPTLNKEKVVWGSFDMKYALNYTREYSFGNQENQSNQTISVGRGGAMKYLFSKIVSGELSTNDIFGRGLDLMYVEGARNEEYFVDQYNINSIGSASGFFQFYVVFGFLGTFVTLLFVLSLLKKVKNKRIRFGLFCIFFWEFFLYTGVTLREPALSFIFIYLIVFSNYFPQTQIQLLKIHSISIFERAI